MMTIKGASSEQEESTEEHEMTHQQRMKIMKDMTKKIRSKGRMDAESCRDCIKQNQEQDVTASTPRSFWS